MFVDSDVNGAQEIDLCTPFAPSSLTSCLGRPSWRSLGEATRSRRLRGGAPSRGPGSRPVGLAVKDARQVCLTDQNHNHLKLSQRRGNRSL